MDNQFTPRLFVDCDDTLVLWYYDRKFGYTYRKNHISIGFVKRWRKAVPHGELTIWSLGGEPWARQVARECFPELVHGEDYKTMERYPRIALFNEVYLDDDPFEEYVHQTYDPVDDALNNFHHCCIAFSHETGGNMGDCPLDNHN